MSGSFLTKKEELSLGKADSQRRNPLRFSIKKYEYLWNSLYVKKYEYLWNRVVAKITSNYLASFDCQIAIAYLAIKERKIAKSI